MNRIIFGILIGVVAAPGIVNVLAQSTQVCTPGIGSGSVGNNTTPPVAQACQSVSPGQPGAPGGLILDQNGSMKMNITNSTTLPIAGSIGITGLPHLNIDSMPAQNFTASFASNFTANFPSSMNMSVLNWPTPTPFPQYPAGFNTTILNGPLPLQVNGTLQLLPPLSPPLPPTVFQGRVVQSYGSSEQTTQLSPTGLLSHLGINLTAAQFTTCTLRAVIQTGQSVQLRRFLVYNVPGQPQQVFEAGGLLFASGPQAATFTLTSAQLGSAGSEMADATQWTVYTPNASTSTTIEYRSACVD